MNSTGQFKPSQFEVEADNLVVRSLLYREFGFENALVNWVIHHRARWRKERRQRIGEMARGCF